MWRISNWNKSVFKSDKEWTRKMKFVRNVLNSCDLFVEINFEMNYYRFCSKSFKTCENCSFSHLSRQKPAWSRNLWELMLFSFLFNSFCWIKNNRFDIKIKYSTYYSVESRRKQENRWCWSRKYAPWMPYVTRKFHCFRLEWEVSKI